jgi:hypothetical protein
MATYVRTVAPNRAYDHVYDTQYQSSVVNGQIRQHTLVCPRV